MKRILILGAGNAQIDAIDYCKQRGYEVIGCSYTSNDKGIPHLDVFENADIRDSRAVLGLAKQYDVDLIYSIGSDLAMPTAMRVSEALDLPHFVSEETALMCQRKDLMRERLGNAFSGNLSYSLYETKEDALCHSNFPAMMKPIDSQGQRGCHRVDSREDIKEFFDSSMSFSSEGKVIIEDYIGGPEVSVNMYFQKGTDMLCFISDRYAYKEYPGGIVKRHSVPSILDDATKRDIRETATKAAAMLGITDGPAYFQIKMDKDHPVIIEVCPRLDGCHMWKLIRYCYGIDLLDIAFTELISGKRINIETVPETTEKYSLSFLSQSSDTLFAYDNFNVVDAEEIHYYYDEGDKIASINGYYEKCGYVISKD